MERYSQLRGRKGDTPYLSESMDGAEKRTSNVACPRLPFVARDMILQ